MDEDTSDTPTLPATLSAGEDRFAGRYRIRGRLGRGASKDVYLAYDERLDREVALAIVIGAAAGERARERVRREAQVTGRLGDHPNVVTVYDAGEHDGVPYLVLRAMAGGSLTEQLRAGPLAPERAARIAGQIATALAHVHAHGVVHRDVKPDNVWLTAEGDAALGDFGVAHDHAAERLTLDGAVVGTARYLSPEQARGEPVTPASDLYALGVTLYELLTGRPPFTGDDPAALLAQHLAATPAAPSEPDRRGPAGARLTRPGAAGQAATGAAAVGARAGRDPGQPARRGHARGRWLRRPPGRHGRARQRVGASADRHAADRRAGG